MFEEFVTRLIFAGLMGGAIGIEREYRAKGAGFRTHFLVSIGSALIMIVSQHGFADVLGMEGIGLDPSRVAAGVVTGIGFIGAGTIIMQKQFVKGLTTAAGIWATSGIGLAVGGGMYWLAAVATVLVLLGMEIFAGFFAKIGIFSANIGYCTRHYENLTIVSDMLRKKGARIVSYAVKKSLDQDGVEYYVTMTVKTRSRTDEDQIFSYIQSLPDTFIDRME